MKEVDVHIRRALGVAPPRESSSDLVINDTHQWLDLCGNHRDLLLGLELLDFGSQEIMFYHRS